MDNGSGDSYYNSTLEKKYNKLEEKYKKLKTKNKILKIELKEAELMLYSASLFLTHMDAARKAHIKLSFERDESFTKVPEIKDITIRDILNFNKAYTKKLKDNKE